MALLPVARFREPCELVNLLNWTNVMQYTRTLGLLVLCSDSGIPTGHADDVVFEPQRIRFIYAARNIHCDYEFEWLKLSKNDLETMIHTLTLEPSNSVIGIYLQPPVLLPIWIRQARGAQVTPLPIPTDLQRVVFGFLIHT